MKKILLSVLVYCLGAGASLANVSDDPDLRDPHSIIEETMAHILQDLEQNRANYEADPTLLRNVVSNDLLPLIDHDYSARLILGKAGRGASPEQVKAFADAMSSVLTNRYSDGLLEFRSDRQIDILPLKGKNSEKLTRVRTRITLNNGGKAPIDYAFRKTPAGWKVFDLTVEGISYIITLRNQISPRVLAEGLDKVTEDILAGNIQLND